MPKKILWIEDEPFLASIFKELCDEAGYTADFALDGEKGISLAFANKYDLIITCIMLPKLDGMEVIRRIKSNDNSKNTPIVVCSNMGNEKIVNDCLKLGAIKFIVKSAITPDQLLNEIKLFLGDQQDKKANADEN